MGTPLGKVWRLRMLDGSVGWIERAAAREMECCPDPDARAGAVPAAAAAREEIVRTARLFLGDPYYWGGRSAHNPEADAPPHTGMDCSGLVGLLYRAAGIPLPRDAHEQWMKARAITRDELGPADLIFFSDPKNLKKITHVMFYAGGGQVIEGPGTGEKAREIPLEERLKETGGRKVFYGTYLP
jgi:cell wall-associated NlpC family hydrolase